MRSERRTGEARAAFWMLLPALSLIAVFFVLPILASFLLSLTDFDLYALASPRNARFVGLANYVRLAEDPTFWKALRNTFLFVLAGGPASVAVALGAALLVNARVTRFKTLFRTAFFAPVVTTMVAVATVWRFLYHPRVGLFNRALDLVGLAPIDWLGDPRWALLSICLLAVWKNFGYQAILFVAGLQAIPESLYEAARIEGAGPWQQFRHITLPSLAPTFLFVAVTTSIGYFQLFSEPYVMTPDGGPLGSTLSVAFLMYREGFRWWNLGYGAAIAFALFAVILIATRLQLQLFGRRA
ncbi:MAG TPA: sugar ABC transporter permease [Thermoanaerobaculia bacterium]|nr:sugar ABC transporter permease [Thermoanaerobaculia bacterium]